MAKPAPNWSLLPGSRQSESLIDNGGGLGQQPIVSAQNRVRSVEGYGVVNRWRIISWGLPPAHKWWDRDLDLRSRYLYDTRSASPPQRLNIK